MELDINRYRSFVDRFDMPEEQKVAVLTHVWSIMGSFVDRAFGHAPEQQLPDLGGMKAARAAPVGLSALAMSSDNANQVRDAKARDNAHRELAHQPKSKLDLAAPLTPIFTDEVTLLPTLYRVVGELAPEPEMDPLEHAGTSSPIFSPMPPHPAGAISPDISSATATPSVSDSIRRLAADRVIRAGHEETRANELASLQARGIDPLEL